MNDKHSSSPADLLRAFAVLSAADDEARRGIARMLGINWGSPPTPPLSSKGRHHVGGDPARDGGAAEPSFDTPPPATWSPAGNRKKIPSELTREDEAVNRPPDWLRTAEPLEEPREHEGFKAPAVEPLFRPNWTRHILSGALSTPGEEGRVDIAQVVRAIARAESLRELPRRPRPTLSRGLQLLIDTGEAMEPFAHDQVQLLEFIIKVIGKDKCEALSFAGCPVWGAGRGGRDEWAEYSPPPPRTPVLLLTDLGIGRPPLSVDRASVKDWLTFASRLRRSGCPAVAFVPYAPARWPPQLMRSMTILHWDRTTTVAMVKHVVGQGLRVAGEGQT